MSAKILLTNPMRDIKQPTPILQIVIRTSFIRKLCEALKSIMHPHRNHNNQDTPAWGFAHKVHLWQMLDWRSYLLIGALLFIMFYWVIPEWLHYELDVLQQGTPRPITATLLARRIDWIQYCGMALGAGCILFAMRNYLDLYISEKNRNVEFFNRLFTRGNSE